MASVRSDLLNLIIISFFFLNQHFITQGMRADHDSYFITTYMTNKTTWRIEKERREKEEREEMKEKKKLA